MHSPVSTPLRRSGVHYKPLMKEQAREIVANMARTGYTYAQRFVVGFHILIVTVNNYSASYNSSYPTDYRNPGLIGFREDSSSNDEPNADRTKKSVILAFLNSLIGIICCIPPVSFVIHCFQSDTTVEPSRNPIRRRQQETAQHRQKRNWLWWLLIVFLLLSLFYYGFRKENNEPG